MRAYLAGPEVFLPNPAAIGRKKKEICEYHGLAGAFPMDAEIDLTGLTPTARGHVIYRADVAMMVSCDLIIANITPFRGPSADVGTAFEMGYMAALGKPVFAYSNVKAGFLDRTRAHFGGALYHRKADGKLADPMDMAVEEFDMADNLMLHGALVEDGLFVHDAPPGSEFTDLVAFEAAVKAAAERYRKAPASAGR